MTALLRTQLAASAGSDLTFTVPVVPRGWARARLNGQRHFKDEKTARFEDTIGRYALAAMHGRMLFYGPVELTIVSVLPIPPSWKRSKRDAALKGDLRPTGKPDHDNLAKAASDALNRIVFLDDAQVVDCRSAKFFGEIPYVQIAVRAAPFSAPGNVIPFSRPGGADGSFLEESTAGR